VEYAEDKKTLSLLQQYARLDAYGAKADEKRDQRKPVRGLVRNTATSKGGRLDERRN